MRFILEFIYTAIAPIPDFIIVGTIEMASLSMLRTRMAVGFQSLSLCFYNNL